MNPGQLLAVQVGATFAAVAFALLEIILSMIVYKRKFGVVDVLGTMCMLAVILVAVWS